MSDPERKFDPTVPQPKIDKHLPFGSEIVGPENPRILDRISRGEFVQELFRGQSALYIPNHIAEMLGDDFILQTAKSIYTSDQYDGVHDTPIRVIRHTNSWFIDLPRCPIIIDDKEKEIGHFDTTQIDTLTDLLKKKFEELSQKK
ncbi:MAG: hypothetical protein WCV83_03665 [Candidatus Magasanikbacteria bacterium]